MTTTAPNNLNILVVGCGKMGSAIVERWLNTFLNLHITIVEPAAQLPDNIDKKYYSHIQHYTNISDLPPFTGHAVLLAVKPQIMADICNQLKNKISTNTPIISIAAGKEIKFYESFFGNNHAIIRTIPNTPAAIGHGITGMIANPHTNTAQRQLAEKLMATTGSIFWIENESMMNDLTAIASSGVAYIFYMMEVLTKAAETSGFSKEQAEAIGKQTVIGAALLAQTDSTTSPARLRENVTSPQGTTHAGLTILMDTEKGLNPLMEKTIQAAINRGIELAK